MKTLDDSVGAGLYGDAGLSGRNQGGEFCSRRENDPVRHMGVQEKGTQGYFEGFKAKFEAANPGTRIEWVGVPPRGRSSSRCW